MSPEVLRGDGYDFKSDIWSLGCLLYELTMLKSPFKAEGLNLYSLFQKISQGDYQPLPENYSESLRNLAYRMISTRSEDRPEISDACVTASALRLQTANIKKSSVDIPINTITNSSTANDISNSNNNIKSGEISRGNESKNKNIPLKSNSTKEVKSKNTKDEDSHVDSVSIKEENSNMDVKDDKMINKSDEKNNRKKEILVSKDIEFKEINNKVLIENENDGKINNNNSNNEKKSIIVDNNIDKNFNSQQNDNLTTTNNKKSSNKISSNSSVVESKVSTSPKDDRINQNKNDDIESKTEINIKKYSEKDNNINNIKIDESKINDDSNKTGNHNKNGNTENKNSSNYNPTMNLIKKDVKAIPKSLKTNDNGNEKKYADDKIKINDSKFKKEMIIKTNSNSSDSEYNNNIGSGVSKNNTIVSSNSSSVSNNNIGSNGYDKINKSRSNGITRSKGFDHSDSYGSVR